MFVLDAVARDELGWCEGGTVGEPPWRQGVRTFLPLQLHGSAGDLSTFCASFLGLFLEEQLFDVALYSRASKPHN